MAQLIWSPGSLKDQEIIFEYIQQDSNENARKFIEELIQTAVRIPQFPISGRIVSEFKDLKTREKIYKNYRIIYRIQEEYIELITVLHQAKRLIRQEL